MNIKQKMYAIQSCIGTAHKLFFLRILAEEREFSDLQKLCM